MSIRLQAEHEDISNYTTEELKKLHKEVYLFIKEPGIKVDGVNPLGFKKKLIENAKKRLSSIEMELKNKGEKVPKHGKLEVTTNLINKLLRKCNC